MNTNEEGNLSFGTAIDLTGIDEGFERIEQKVAEAGAKVENESSRIADLLSNVPAIDIDINADTSSLQAIGQGLDELHNVVEQNAAAIVELEKAKKSLDADNAKSLQQTKKEAEGYRQQSSVIDGNIKLRKEIVAKAKSYERQLQSLAKKITEEKNAIDENNSSLDKNAAKHENLRQKIKAVKEQMADLIANGIDEQSSAYKDLANELGRLTDIQGDVAQQGKVLANDEAQIAGVIQGLSGLTGAFSAAQGAVALFGEENEELQAVMLKVQSLMAITMGLQQVQQTLNKDSAFQLVTLNGLKEWWNRLLAIGAGEATAEAAATATNTASQVANAAATEADAVAKQAKAGASAKAAIAEGSETAATNANTGASIAGTAANISLAGAFRMVGAAIKSIPVFGWIAAAIGVLIGVIYHFVSETKKASKELQEQQKLLEEGRKKYAEVSVEIANYSKKIEAATGNQKQEKQLVEELNTKYGTAMGYYKSLGEWKDVLTTKGEAYCRKLQKEAEAQALLAKYTEAYINLLEVQEKAKAGEFDHWYYSDEANEQLVRRQYIEEAEKEMDKWLAKYNESMDEAQSIADNFDLNPHIDPNSEKATFDPKAAARAQKEAIRTLSEAVKKFNKEAQNEITQYSINEMSDGLGRELAEIERNAQLRKDAWANSLRELAKIAKESEKQTFLSKKGNTLDMWEDSAGGQKTIEEYVKDLLKIKNISEENAAILQAIEDERLRNQAAANQRYTDALIEEYGTTAQKMEKLDREWAAKIAHVPEEYLDKAIKQMEDDFAKLASEAFKESIDWDAVFGDMGKQSVQTLQYNLDKVKQFFEANKSSMDVKQIKEYQEAIANMENEIASRNPFAAFHKSLKDITTSKTEFTLAMQEWKDTQAALKTAQDEYNEALRQEQEIQAQVDAGKLTQDSEKYTQAVEKRKTAYTALTRASQNNNAAEQKALSSRNNITVAYKSFATQMRAVGGVVQDVGGKAKNLAAVFSDDVAKGIDTALNTIGAVMDAAAAVIDVIGDTGKSVSEGLQATAEASGQSMQATATATATAISTVEKASVILTIISAALQVATAIANMFNDDDAKQAEIENLQRRIDQLQWELDNADAVRLQNKLGDAVQRVRDVYAETTEEILGLHLTTRQLNNHWVKWFATRIFETEIWNKSIEKIADAYAKAAYTADKALGNDKYADSRKRLENLAEQQLLIEKQINEERSKKDTDDSKIEEWERDIQEIAEQMATVINEMLEDIIGASAEDLASQLGDAFFEAAAQGEDAMEAWHSKVKEIVADVTKRMLIAKFLEEPLGEIFDRYKKKWFPNGMGDNAVELALDSMNDFADDLNQVGERFQNIWSTLPDTVKDWFTDDAERQGASKGIATASQDSVDENNARLTTIQGHTFSLVQGMEELNRTTNTILERVTGIERNTSATNDRLNNIDNKIKNINDTVDDIYLKGIKIK